MKLLSPLDRTSGGLAQGSLVGARLLVEDEYVSRESGSVHFGGQVGTPNVAYCDVLPGLWPATQHFLFKLSRVTKGSDFVDIVSTFDGDSFRPSCHDCAVEFVCLGLGVEKAGRDASQ
jgi:hypothetical protein